MNLSKAALALVSWAAIAARSSAFLTGLPGTSAGNAAAFRPAAVSGPHNHHRPLFLFNKLFGTTSQTGNLPVIADDSVMNPKAHGTSERPVMNELRWKCDRDTADRICNFNRHYAEYSGYWQTTEFLKAVKNGEVELPIKFYDSVTGKLLFTAPIGRTLEDFLLESQKHGWPSFRDEEVNWENVGCLRNGECVSFSGTHLGHNIPDKTGNRYCINLVSVAGQPAEGEES